ncbi:unnamed protein product, partial [Ectocarpus sp. 6 AP-2014]
MPTRHKCCRPILCICFGVRVRRNATRSGYLARTRVEPVSKARNVAAAAAAARGDVSGKAATPLCWPLHFSTSPKIEFQPERTKSAHQRTQLRHTPYFTCAFLEKKAQRKYERREMKPLDCYSKVATISVSQERERETDRENYFPPAF